MGSKIIQIKGVGEVMLERSPKAKRICLSVRPFRGIRVAVPDGVTFEQAKAVVQNKAMWIEKQLKHIAELEKAARDFDRRLVNRIVARRVIVDRVSEFARRYHFCYGRVFVRNQRTRWGSCSSQNNINLNVNLIRLPLELRDYVILHELVHTRIKDHSLLFWQTLEKYMPDCKQRDKQLNAYAPMLLL